MPWVTPDDQVAIKGTHTAPPYGVDHTPHTRSRLEIAREGWLGKSRDTLLGPGVLGYFLGFVTKI